MEPLGRDGKQSIWLDPGKIRHPPDKARACAVMLAVIKRRLD